MLRLFKAAFGAVTMFLIAKKSVFAADAIKISAFESFIDSILKTIQYYSLPIMGIILAGLGLKLLLSADETNTKEVLKNWMVRVLVAGLIIFGATAITNALRVPLNVAA